MNDKTMASIFRAAVGVLATMALVGFTACQPKAVRPASAPTVPAVTTEVDTTGAIRYQVDSAASEVRILAYRGGAMARFGHNHVLRSNRVTGQILLHSDLGHSQVQLSLPVASLDVDDPKIREAEGPDFAAEVPEEAREGTRRNLLRAEVLDAAQFPTITLQSVAIAGTRDAPSLIMRVTIKGVSHDVVVLATVEEQKNLLLAEGEFTILQSDFGMTPFNAALGALQVQDKLRIRFSIKARS
jgi:polyisoprenoid-binding protein YceI